MRTAILAVTVALMIGCTGCVWPAATCISGQTKVEWRWQRPDSSLPTSETRPPRLIVVKYWRVQELFNSGRMKFEFFGAEATDQAVFAMSFPFRFYPAIWTPALGEQHLLPDAGLIIFAEGYWPSHVIADDGRRCCEAPTTGERHWHVAMQPLDQAPESRQPAKGWDKCEFPPITLDELDGVLRWNRSLTEADRRMARQQLERLLDYWRRNPPTSSR